MLRKFLVLLACCAAFAVGDATVSFATADGSADNALNHNTASDCLRMENSIGHFTSGFTIHNFISNVSRGRASGCGGSPAWWVDNEYSVFESAGISPPNPSFCYYIGTAGWTASDFITQDDYYNSTPCSTNWYATSSNHYLSWYSGWVDDYYQGMVSGWNYLHT
jgi:hypothetical protein